MSDEDKIEHLRDEIAVLHKRIFEHEALAELWAAEVLKLRAEMENLAKPINPLWIGSKGHT